MKDKVSLEECKVHEQNATIIENEFLFLMSGLELKADFNEDNIDQEIEELIESSKNF